MKNDSGYIKRFAKVMSETSSSEYTLSVLEYKNGNPILGCSCPAWRTRVPRQDCKHIRSLLNSKMNNASVEILDKEVFESLRFLTSLE